MAAMEQPWVKRLIWSGILAATGALANILAERTAAALWRKLFAEEPPQ